MGTIMLLGIGKVGCDIVSELRMETKHQSLRNSKYVFADCDADHLSRHNYDWSQTVLLEKSSNDFPSDVFNEVEQLIIVAGMNGYTGSKYSVLAAEEASRQGVKDIAVFAILGFMCEGIPRIKRAFQSLDTLRKLPKVRCELYNMEVLVKEYSYIDIFTAFEKCKKEIIGSIESSVEVWNEGCEWDGYTLFGNKYELNNFINDIENNRIDKYDILNTLSKNGINWVASSESTEFGLSLRRAFEQISLYRIDKLFLCFSCGSTLPSISEVSAIHAILEEAGVTGQAEVKLSLVFDKKVGDKIRTFIVASREETSEGADNSVHHMDFDSSAIDKQIFGMRNFNINK